MGHNIGKWLRVANNIVDVGYRQVANKGQKARFIGGGSIAVPAPGRHNPAIPLDGEEYRPMLFLRGCWKNEDGLSLLAGRWFTVIKAGCIAEVDFHLFFEWRIKSESDKPFGCG